MIISFFLFDLGSHVLLLSMLCVFFWEFGEMCQFDIPFYIGVVLWDSSWNEKRRWKVSSNP